MASPGTAVAVGDASVAGGIVAVGVAGAAVAVSVGPTVGVDAGAGVATGGAVGGVVGAALGVATTVSAVGLASGFAATGVGVVVGGAPCRQATSPASATSSRRDIVETRRDRRYTVRARPLGGVIRRTSAIRRDGRDMVNSRT